MLSVGASGFRMSGAQGRIHIRCITHLGLDGAYRMQVVRSLKLHSAWLDAPYSDTGGMHLERYRPGSPLPGALLKRVLHGLAAARHSMKARELLAGLASW